MAIFLIGNTETASPFDETLRFSKGYPRTDLSVRTYRKYPQGRRRVSRYTAGAITIGTALALLLGAGALWSSTANAFSQETSLPTAVEELLDLPRLPAVSVDPQGRYLLLVHERGLLPIEYLRNPTLTVAGLRLNPSTGGPHAPLAYFGLTLVGHESGETTRIPLPEDVTIGYPRWAPDGSRFAFTVTVPTSVELWIGDPITKSASRLSEVPLNAAQGAPCSWMPDSRDVLCRVVVENRGSLADGALAQTVSPVMSTGVHSLIWNSDALDDQLVDYFLKSQLELINVVSGERQRVGEPAILESVESAPNGQLFLVTRVVPAHLLPAASDHSHKVIEIWDRGGQVVQTLSAGPPAASNALRAVHWRATAPASIVWVKRENGKDRISVQAAPFSTPAIEIYRTQHRFAGLKWLESSNLALVSEFDPTHRLTRTWLVNSEDVQQPRRRMGSRSADAAYPAIGRPLSRINDTGKSVVRVQDNAIYVIGRSGGQSYLERLQLDSMRSERVWESDGRGYEKVIDLLTPDASLLLTHYENAREPQNYVVYDLHAGSAQWLTHRKHPAPELADVRRIALRYQREDGVELSATLYVPPDQKPGAALPLLVWAYPRQHGYDTAPVAPDSLDRFPTFERAFKLFFVMRGYAVLDEVSMPIVGNADTANDTFLEQIIANAEVAVKAAADTGYADSDRVGIVGRSYGAFMVANLLAHSHLFATGVAMSGSYNRTLTPFGFQTERRTLWEARDTYLKISPLLYADQIDVPLLLVHGALDDNTGTPPIQSEHLYEAIRHNGGEAELLLLPFEGHSYRARQSVLQVAAAMLAWFDRTLGSTDNQNGALANSSGE